MEETEMAFEEGGGKEEEEYGITLPCMQKSISRARPRKSYHVSRDLCQQLIWKAVCKNEWEKAAGLFTSYLQILMDRGKHGQTVTPEIIWRIGSEILLNHPKSTNADINIFHEAMKNIGHKNYLRISLEQVYHCLCNGQVDEAHRVLSLAQSWRSGLHSSEQKRLQKLIDAYRAVLNYRSWVDKGSAMSQNDPDHSAQSVSSHAMDSYYRQATTSFQEILTFPGVWDPFILNYVDLLESSGKNQEAEKVLTEYANDPKNPANPNALVYLYEFMERHAASEEKLIEVLRVLNAKTPSHKLMLKFSKLLGNSDSENNQKFSLHVLFDLLDFSGWKKDVKAWSYFAKKLRKAFRGDRSAWILEEWQPRRSWWPSYHFTTYQAENDWRDCEKLAVKKASVAGMLQGPTCSYFTWIYKCGRKERTTALNRTKAFIRKNNCEILPLPSGADDVMEAAMG
ncbi:TATA box-binding protein-associated factor RNA polymerase I subunit A [Ranitomeya imitator]|uniref:TATA box-binding protein-associated factor RNA polymerase I subunit A n=1 Tax=Ranitomeya imitator TaxID=111125 RepID=UPI0037E70BCF